MILIISQLGYVSPTVRFACGQHVSRYNVVILQCGNACVHIEVWTDGQLCLGCVFVLFVFSPVFEAFLQFRFKGKDMLTGVGT